MKQRQVTRALALLAVGAALLALADGQTWVTAHVPPAQLLAPTGRPRDVAVTGAHLGGGLAALALAALAAGAALLATRGRGRLLVGLLSAAIGAGALALTVRTIAERAALAGRSGSVTTLEVAGRSGPVPASLSGWPALALLGGVALLAAGALGVLSARQATGLSARYEPPVRAAAAAPKAAGAGQAGTGQAGAGQAQAGQAGAGQAGAGQAGAGQAGASQAGEPGVQEARADTEVALWGALDRGEDPTAAG